MVCKKSKTRVKIISRAFVAQLAERSLGKTEVSGSIPDEGSSMMNCPVCQKILVKDQRRFCSNRCQMRAQHQQYISQWKLGLARGDKGINTKGISSHVKRYLEEKFGEKCSLCGWNKQNPITSRVPLEIDHRDGNSENCNEENLRLICPNCHSLSPNFRNLNKGNGRAWRKAKYIKNSLEKLMV